MFSCSSKFSWETFVLRTLKMLTATLAPSREQCSHSPVLGKCVYLEWISLLNSIYEITIYLWVILKYLSPHLPSLIYSASSRSRSINGKLLITLSEMLKRLLRVKGILLSRGTKKASRLPTQSRIYLQRKVLYIDKGYFRSSQGGGEVVTGSTPPNANTSLLGDY